MTSRTPQAAPTATLAPPPLADQALLERLRAGENAAYDDLVRQTGGRLLVVARRMLTREDEAQDAVQEAFLSAFKSLDRFDGRSQLATWLHRICVNVCLMRLRTRRRKPETTIGDLLPQFLEDGHQKNPAQVWKPIGASGIEKEELRATIRAKIDELPETYREVLLLRDIEELGTEETADLLGLTEAGVKTRLHRARQALKTLLDPLMAEGML